ncbi:hypothetical protein LEN26_001678 [Aphanomyces euteiches]|nr:hypothetical protein AeMF1_018628 [Aphanomyces euteiches]KAH9160896.1 hypothetical protein LEN26_001678 [Aphanomyces euteiches]KAH9194426.1 hypothetical protein AeNC1_003607 [Aphanomyces euteiches]
MSEEAQKAIKTPTTMKAVPPSAWTQFPSREKFYRVKVVPSADGVLLSVRSRRTGTEWQCSVADMTAHAIDNANADEPQDVWSALKMAIEDESPGSCLDLVEDDKGQLNLLFVFRTSTGAVRGYQFCLLPLAEEANSEMVSMMKSVVQSPSSASRAYDAVDYIGCIPLQMECRARNTASIYPH